MQESSALSSPPSGSPSPTASFAGSSAASRPRRPRRPRPDSHVTLNEVKGLNRNEILRFAQNDRRLHSSKQTLRIDVDVVAQPACSPPPFHFPERRLHGLPQRRPVQTLHRELPAEPQPMEKQALLNNLIGLVPLRYIWTCSFML